MPEPIDYARAESDDVVRKKFRRRAVWFLVVTVVVMVIGSGWVHSSRGGVWALGWREAPRHSVTLLSNIQGWVLLWGPTRETALEKSGRGLDSYELGIKYRPGFESGMAKWIVAIRYRTLFLLAAIPWLITLIRLIRSWKKRKGLSAEF